MCPAPCEETCVLGINEDPVTGAAHCMLAPYWARRLGRSEMVGFQASRRGGVVRVRVRTDGDRVDLLGRAVREEEWLPYVFEKLVEKKM